MGLFSGSSSKTKQETTNVNYNDQFSTDEGIIASRDSSVVITDAGQTENALDFAREVTENQTSLTRDLYDTASGLAGDFMSGVKSIFGEAVGAYDDQNIRAYNFANDSYSRALGLVDDANESILAQNRDTVDAINEASKTTSNQIALAYKNAQTGNTYLDPKYLLFGLIGLTAIIFIFRN